VAPEVDGGDSSRRRRRSELRELVLAAGVELVLREPLNLRPESLSYASVFAYIEEKLGIKVYRSSVHKRIWDTHDDYWREVLTRGIYSDPNVSPAAVARLMDYSPATRPDGSVHRRQVAMDIVRVVTGAETEHSLRSIDYLRRQSIKAALMTAPASQLMSSLRQVIRRTQQEQLAHHVEAVRANVVSLGFEVRPEMGIDEDEALRIVVSLALTAASGAVFDTSAGVETATKTFAVRRVDDPGRTDEWLASSMLTWACFDYLFRELP
jgi:hypothetical protein